MSGPRTSDPTTSDGPGGEDTGAEDTGAEATRADTGDTGAVAPAGAAAVRSGDDDAPPPWLLPLWCEIALVVMAAVVAGVGGAGLLLADLGRYGLASALLWGLLVAVVVGGPALARIGRRRNGRPAHLPTVAMVVVAVVSAVLNARWATETVLVGGDNGVDAVAGRWLAERGTLQVPLGSSWSAVASLTDPGSTGLHADPSGSLEFSSDHLYPVLVAVAHGLGGDGAAAALNAVLGAVALLAIYAVGLRVCGRPWLVLAAVTTLGMTLPQLQAARETLTTTVTQLLLWLGVWALLTAWERRSLGLAPLAGLTLGATLMARIDSLQDLTLIPVVVGVAWVAASDPGGRRRLALGALTALVAAVPVGALAAVDLSQRGTPDTATFRAQVDHPLLLVAVATVVGLVIVVVGARITAPRWWTGARHRVGSGAGAAIALGLVVAWALRPAVQQLRGAPDVVTAALQAHEFVPAAPELTYSEYTLTWFSWYLGPVALVLAIVGAGLLTRTAFRGGAAALLVLAVVGPSAVRYLYAVSDTPDQIDVMQRFVPAVLPAFALAAAVGLEALAVVAVRLGRPSWGRVVTAVGAVAFLVFPLARLAPVHAFRDEDGYRAVVERVCTEIGPRAAVVFAPGDALGAGLAQTVRSFCQVPVTRFVATPGSSGLVSAVAGAEAQHRTLWVLGGSRAVVESTVSGSSAVQLAAVTNTGELETTLTRPPAEYVAETLAVWGVELRSGGN